jgi:hypothetical protein
MGSRSKAQRVSRIKSIILIILDHPYMESVQSKTAIQCCTGRNYVPQDLNLWRNFYSESRQRHDGFNMLWDRRVEEKSTGNPQSVHLGPKHTKWFG